MKKILILVMFLYGLFCHAERLIIVSGQASQMIEPNILRVSFEAWGKANDAKSAQKLSAKSADELRKKLLENKIKKEDVQTQGLNVTPEYSWENNKQKLQGYRSVQNFSVVFRDLKTAGSVLDLLIFSSKNNETGVSLLNSSLDSDQREIVQNQVLGEAVADAKLKAEVIAKAAGVKIKWLYKVNYSQPSYEAPRFLMAASMEKSSDSVSTTIDPGKMKITVDLTAEYEIQ